MLCRHKFKVKITVLMSLFLCYFFIKSFLVINYGKKQRLAKFKAKHKVKVGSHYVDPEETALEEDEIEIVKEEIREINKKQEIFNLDRYGPVNHLTPIILIQVSLNCSVFSSFKCNILAVEYTFPHVICDHSIKTIILEV